MQIRRWDDAYIDPRKHVQRQDLVTVLSKTEDFKLDYAFGSFIDVMQKRITVNTFWEQADDEREAGYRTDIYLRAIGTMHQSNLQSLLKIRKVLKKTSLEKFGQQMFTLLEDLRLEKYIKRDRLGTAQDFSRRREFLQHYFTNQLRTNIMKGDQTSELFCLIYLVLQANEPKIYFKKANYEQVVVVKTLQNQLNHVYEAETTGDIASLTREILAHLVDTYDDITNDYFVFPVVYESELEEAYTLFDSLQRIDDVANDDEHFVDDKEQEYYDETLSTWHHESKDEQQTFLQMDLEFGTKTNIKGGGARQTESGDQAFASAQGTSGKSKHEDYSRLETLLDHAKHEAEKQTDHRYGEENKQAVPVFKEAEQPNEVDILHYVTFASEVNIYKQQLLRTIEKMLERKRETSRENLHFGRLSKHLLPIVTEKNPRLFYKKDEDSHTFDAVFTLMIDCSASMHDKMEETKRNVVLFHEVLKQLHIPHMIVGFWEDSISLTNNEHRNYFHIVHSFDDSLYENHGPKIMQLKSQEDNRDGYSIRIVTEQMLKRREHHKFLLIFSDGQPSAENYEDNGVVDTHLAVIEARKQGIDLIGIFLADGEIDEQEEKIMENIYGRSYLMVPSISELPDLFTSILRKIILTIGH